MKFIHFDLFLDIFNFDSVNLTFLFHYFLLNNQVFIFVIYYVNNFMNYDNSGIILLINFILIFLFDLIAMYYKLLLQFTLRNTLEYQFYYCHSF